nr:MAG TPA: hypothetical protein [Caudoviricetes sp.]
MGVSGSPNGCCQTSLGQLLGIANADVLRSVVAVMD